MNQKKITPALFIVWIIVMAAGAVLLFTGITHESLWYDESYTAALVNHPFGDIINITGGDSHPPLYYLMLRLFRLIFGNSVFSLRTFSILGALALAAWGIGPVRRAVGEKAGILYSMLALAMPITVSMAQEIRMYTWAAFFVTGSALYGYLAQKEGKTRDWIVFGLCSLAAAYTHYYALLAVAVICALLLLGVIIEKKKLIPLLCVGSAVIIAYIPWLIKLTGQVSRVTGSYWIPPVTGQVIKNVFVYPFSNKFSNPTSPTLVTAVFLIAALLILWGIVSRIIRRDESVKMAVLAVGAYLLTIGAGITASLIIRPVLVERYMVPVLGLFIIGLAYGIANLGKIAGPVIASVVILAVSGLQIQHTVTTRFSGPMTEAVNYLSSQVQPGDVFLHTDEHTFGTFCYYFPDYTNYYYQREGYEGFSNYAAFRPNGLLLDSLDGIGRDHRVWLVQRFGAADTVSASGWMGSGLLRMNGAPKVFQLPQSWYGFSVYSVNVAEPGDAAAVSSDATTGNLTVRFTGFRNDNGKVTIGLYQKDQAMTGNALFGQEAEISGGQAQVVFENIPFGEYAAVALHDENGNGQPDMKNNIPTDGIGYSGSFEMPQGPPEYDKCKFTFDAAHMSIDMVIFYIPQQ